MNMLFSDQNKCPSCAPVAPLWMTTFADMALLLMAFFAIMYSFTNIDAHEQTKFAAAIKSGFGIMKLDMTDSNDLSNQTAGGEFTADTVLGRPALLAGKTREKTDIDMQGLPRGKGEKSMFSSDGAFKALKDVLSTEIEKGEVKVKVDGDRVVVELQSFVTSGGEASTREAISEGTVVRQSTLDISKHVVQVQANTKIRIDITKQGLDIEDPRFAARKSAATGTYNAVIIAMEDEIKSNNAMVELKEDQVLVRISNTNAFLSGRAALNQETKRALVKLGESLNTGIGRVRVEGHSDNIPIIFSERFKSNWELSAARASSVAAVLIEDSGIDDRLIKIAGFADTQPVASNSTERGRRLNRRIDIFIQGSPGSGESK